MGKDKIFQYVMELDGKGKENERVPLDNVLMLEVFYMGKTCRQEVSDY